MAGATNPELEELYRKLEAERKRLLRLLQGMDEAQAGEHPGGAWSVKQQVAHLCEAERAWLDWALAVREQPGIQVGHPPQEGPVFTTEVATADTYPLGYWVTRLKLVRAETLRRLAQARLTREELQRMGTHRTFGPMSVLQFLQGIYRHDRMHVDQILGQPPSFVPRQPPVPGGQQDDYVK